MDGGERVGLEPGWSGLRRRMSEEAGEQMPATAPRDDQPQAIQRGVIGVVGKVNRSFKGPTNQSVHRRFQGGRLRVICSHDRSQPCVLDFEASAILSQSRTSDHLEDIRDLGNPTTRASEEANAEFQIPCIHSLFVRPGDSQNEGLWDSVVATHHGPIGIGVAFEHDRIRAVSNEIAGLAFAVSRA